MSGNELRRSAPGKWVASGAVEKRRILNLVYSNLVDETMYGAKNTELRDLVARLTLQLEATDRRKDENADLAIKAFELSQDIA